ncbi:hypothetical protein KR084_008969 [Drosophila pseudotakahashii]|nr:hypothetical protein KR084_008969 [Drosophila pseudotakahashii]
MSTSGLILLTIFLLSAIATLTSAQQIRENSEKERSVRLLDRFDNRYPDGSYEYRFELDDGTARYERGYFAKINGVKTLMVVGYYAYRMTDGRYITVFYNADQFGYRQNQSITPQEYPNLPRSIEVPMASTDSDSDSVSNFQSQSRLESHGNPSATTTTTTTPRGAGTSRRGRY